MGLPLSRSHRAATSAPAAPEAPTLYNTKLWIRPKTYSYTNGQSVTTANDSSPAGNNLTTAASGNAPTFATNLLDGKPALSYANGGAQGLRSAGVVDAAVNNYCMFVVARTTLSGAAGNTYALAANETANGVSFAASGYGGAGWGHPQLYYPGVAAGTVPAANNPAAWRIFAYRILAGTARLYMGGGPHLTSQVVTPAAPTGKLTLGYEQATNYMYGQIAEAIAIYESPTDALMNAIGAYLVGEYPSLAWTAL